MTSPATVLVVEDDPGIAELERGRLEDAGYRAITSDTADAALGEVGRGGIDLVLLDYRLPGGVDGLEFYSRVKAAGHDLPVILVTGFGNEATVIQAMRVGVRDFVTKSLEYLDYLPEAVARVLRQVGMERRLAESEARLGGVIGSAKDAVIVVEADRRVSLFNPAAEKMFGCPSATAVGRRLTEFIPDELAEVEGEADPGSLTHRLQTGNRGVRADGSTFPVEATVSPGRVSGRKFYTLVVRDVTERRRAEETLRASEERFRLLVDGVKDYAIFLLDPTGRVASWNAGAERITGYRADEIVGRHFSDFYPPEARPDGPARELSVAERDGKCEEEGWRIRKDGTRYWADVVVTALRGADGGLIGFSKITRDLTDRRTASEALRRSESLLRRAEAMAHVAAWTYDVASGVYISSDEGGRICGTTPGPHTEDELARLVHPDDLPRVQAALRAALGGTPVEFEHRLIGNGRPKWVSVLAEPEVDADGKVARLTGVTQNVTTRRHLEEQLRQAQKMEAVGQLAGGVAHDFNNILTVINGYSELLLEKAPSADPDRELLVEIREAGERAAALTGQLLAFSRKTIVEPKVLDPNAVVTESGKLLRRLLGADISLATALDPGVGRVRVDPGQLGQVLMNLAVNARDAMPRGGKLTIETQNVDLRGDDGRQNAGFPPGWYVQIAVSDTGVGMPDAVKARVFEPFFTTKAPGEGTGLGLAMVYGITRQNGGHVEVYSEAGVGTTFKVYLPLVDAPASGNGPEPLGIRGGTEAVLLVEDQSDVRRFARLALESYGYAVTPATDGKDALRLAAGQPVDILVTDVVMPGMGGRELADAMRKKYPGVKVLFMSGYTDDAVVRHGVLAADVAFLQKPYTPLDLARKIRQVLDDGVPPADLGGAS